MSLARSIMGIALGILLLSGIAVAVEPAEVERFVKARIDIGEMMMNYFSSGEDAAAVARADERNGRGYPVEAQQGPGEV